MEYSRILFIAQRGNFHCDLSIFLGIEVISHVPAIPIHHLCQVQMQFMGVIIGAIIVMGHAETNGSMILGSGCGTRHPQRCRRFCCNRQDAGNVKKKK